MNTGVIKLVKWCVIGVIALYLLGSFIANKPNKDAWIIENLEMTLAFVKNTLTIEEKIDTTVGNEVYFSHNLQGEVGNLITGIVEYTYKDKKINDRLTSGWFVTPENIAQELGAKKGDTIGIKLLYKINVDMLYRGVDTDILTLKFIDAKKFKLNLIPYTTITDVNVEDALVTENNGVYTIDFGKIKASNLEIKAKIHDVDAVAGETITILTPAGYIVCFMGTTLICLIAVLINNRKKKKVSEYRRETNNLVSPYLAELIVDGKIDMKNLIMTTIIDLELKGKVKILNNDEIELISTEGLDAVQKCMIYLLFIGTGGENRIKLSDINNAFRKSKITTKIFSEKLAMVKKALINTLIATQFISKKKMKIGTIIKTFAAINCILICFLFSGLPITIDAFPIMFAIALVFIFIDSINHYEGNFKSERDVTGCLIVIAGIVAIFQAIGMIKLDFMIYGLEFLLIMAVLFIVNVMVIRESKRILLTPVGEAERIELLKLKKYLTEHSVIKERDLGSVVIWDEYLAYATAFGMPNSIIKQIYEEWYNINMTLQFVSQIL